MNFLFRRKDEKSVHEQLKDINIQILSSVYLSDKMEGIALLNNFTEHYSEDIFQLCFESLKENFNLSFELLYNIFKKNEKLIDFFFTDKNNLTNLLLTERMDEEDLSPLIILLLEYRPEEIYKIEADHLSIFKNEKYNRFICKIENDEFKRNLALENFFEFYLTDLKKYCTPLCFLLKNHEFNQNYFIELNWPMKINTAYKNRILSSGEIFHFFSSLIDLKNKKIKYFQEKIPRKWLYLAIKHSNYDLLYRLIYDNKTNLSLVLNSISSLQVEETENYLTFLSYVIKIVGDENFIFYESILKTVNKESSFFLQLVFLFDYNYEMNYITFNIYSYFENDILANIFLLKDRSSSFIILFTALLLIKEYNISTEESMFINEFMSQYRIERISRFILSTLLEKKEDNLLCLLNNLPALPTDVLCSVKSNILNQINFLISEKSGAIKIMREELARMEKIRETEEKVRSIEILNKSKEDIFDL